MRHCSAVTLGIALLAGCRTVPVPTRDIAVASRSRLLRIEDTRRIDSAFLDSALRSPIGSVRRAAALTAGRVGARTHVAALRALTADSDARVGGAAFYALGLMKDTGAAVLATTALRGSADVAREAAWLLGEVGEPGRMPLTAVAVDSTLDSGRRGAALLALVRLKQPPIASLLPLLAMPTPRSRGARRTSWRALAVPLPSAR
jgi:HEAT repeat protein